VEKGSVAEKAGFKAGDVIVRVDKEHIADRGDWRSAMRRRSGKVTFGIIRDKREQSITVTLPELRNPDNSFHFEIPQMDFEALQKDMDALRPELEKATSQAMVLAGEQMRRSVHDAQVQVRREVKKAQKDMEKSRKEMEKAQKDAEKAIEKSTQ
jgi:membrane-associated protease RseP (regulator of RpoE activity)